MLPLIGAVVVLAACGQPPQPSPTGPPPDFHNPSSAPSGPGAGGMPSGLLPGTYPTAGGYPTTGAYPTYPGYPTYPVYPTYPGYPRATPSASATPSAPPAAPRCTKGPTGAQILAVIKDRPGIPANAHLVVKAGPYCAGTWQFTALGEAGTDVDPLQVVTNGEPAALKLVEAGADVCSDHVHHAAPAGIRVWACGS